MKPSNRVERIRQLIRLADASSANMYVTAALQHFVVLFRGILADVEALKRKTGQNRQEDENTEACVRGEGGSR